MSAKKAVPKAPEPTKLTAQQVAEEAMKSASKAVAELEKFKTSYDSLLSLVADISRRLENVDNVAFAALSLHDGKQYNANMENITKTRDHIEKIVEANNQYRKDLEEARERARVKEEKAAKKKAEVQAKRDAKKAGPKRKKNGKSGEGKTN